MITLSSGDSGNLTTCLLTKSCHDTLHKVEKIHGCTWVENGFLSLHFWKVKVFGNARISSESRVFSGEQGQTDILKA